MIVPAFDNPLTFVAGLLLHDLAGFTRGILNIGHNPRSLSKYAVILLF